MLKRELISALARKHKELKVRDIDLIVRLVFDSMAEALSEGREIEIRGLGSFRIREYESREARNPGTGDKVKLEPRKGVLFRCGLEMKQRLNNEIKRK